MGFKLCVHVHMWWSVWRRCAEDWLKLRWVHFVQLVSLENGVSGSISGGLGKLKADEEKIPQLPLGPTSFHSSSLCQQHTNINTENLLVVGLNWNIVRILAALIQSLPSSGAHDYSALRSLYTADCSSAAGWQLLKTSHDPGDAALWSAISPTSTLLYFLKHIPHHTEHLLHNRCQIKHLISLCSRFHSTLCLMSCALKAWKLEFINFNHKGIQFSYISSVVILIF